MVAPWILKVPDAWDFFGFLHIVPPKIFGCPSRGEFYGMIYLIFILWAWRRLSVKTFPLYIQGWMERWIPTTKFLQWHTIQAFAIGWQLVKVLLKLFVFDWQGSGLKLNPEKVMQVPPVILTLATYSPFACMASIVVLAISFNFFVVGKNRINVVNQETGELSPRHWTWFWQMDVMLLLQMLPVWFNLMPLFAFERIWQVISGTTSPKATFEDYISMSNGCLEIAILMEYLSIHGFCRLYLSYFDEAANHEDSSERMSEEELSSEQTRLTKALSSEAIVRGHMKIYWVLLVASMLCVGSGMLNAFLAIVRLISFHNLPQQHSAELCSPNADAMGMLSAPLYLTVFCDVSAVKVVVDQLSSAMMIALTVLIMIACKYGAVSQRLPQANMKFNGAKIIVMVAQIQGKLLVPQSFLSVEYAKPTVFGAISNSMFNFKGVAIPGWNGYFTALLHCSLLQYEILFVAILQYFLWRQDDFARRFYSKRVPTLEESLLDEQIQE